MKNKKIKYVILTLILIVAIVVVVLILQNRKTENNGNNNQVENITEEENSNLETYKNEAYGIEFKYSKELKNPVIGNYSEINLEYPKIAPFKKIFSFPW